MRYPVHLPDQQLSIVISNARPLPQALIERLESEVIHGDEILVIQNRPASAPRYWVGITSEAESASTTAVTLCTATPIPRSRAVILLNGLDGAAAARNLGWRMAKNDWVLFLDDDVMVDETFLDAVREHLSGKPMAEVVTFRVLSLPPRRWAPLFEATISLDRGPGIRCTDGTSLRLQDVWMYGAGAAMACSRSILKATGGFKDHFGAGRRNGGTEDTEFIWHASRHAAVEYCGDIRIHHESVSCFPDLSRKLREYGRAIGHLGGTTKNIEGYRYVSNYCRHIAAAMYRNDGLGLSRRSTDRVRMAIGMAAAESLRVYALSLLHGHPTDLLCQRCSGRPC